MTCLFFFCFVVRFLSGLSTIGWSLCVSSTVGLYLTVGSHLAVRLGRLGIGCIFWNISFGTRHGNLAVGGARLVNSMFVMIVIRKMIVIRMLVWLTTEQSQCVRQK